MREMLKEGDAVIIISHHGRLHLSKVERLTNTQIIASGNRYRKVDGDLVGGERSGALYDPNEKKYTDGPTWFERYEDQERNLSVQTEKRKLRSVITESLRSASLDALRVAAEALSKFSTLEISEEQRQWFRDFEQQTGAKITHLETITDGACGFDEVARQNLWIYSQHHRDATHPVLRSVPWSAQRPIYAPELYAQTMVG